MALLVVLLLQPVFEEDGTLRLVATGVGSDEVVWSVDGREVGRTHDREALEVALDAGAHNVTAASKAQGDWQAVGRKGGVADGAAFVPAWTAAHKADAPPQAGSTEVAHGGSKLPLLLGGLALVLLIVPGRRGLEARRRRRRA